MSIEDAVMAAGAAAKGLLMTMSECLAHQDLQYACYLQADHFRERKRDRVAKEIQDEAAEHGRAAREVLFSLIGAPSEPWAWPVEIHDGLQISYRAGQGFRAYGVPVCGTLKEIRALISSGVQSGDIAW